jgi:intein/homing endonuclease
MITLKELEEKIPDKIIGVEMHNKNTVVYISNGKIKITSKDSKHGIKQTNRK